MSTTTVVTAEELLAMPMGRGKCYELVAGELRVMSPAGWRHGKIVSRLTVMLGAYVDRHDLGVVFGAETGFRLANNPDTVRAPDVSFIAKRNIPEQEPKDAYWPGAPDLAVEVMSPGDRAGEVDETIDAWLAAGCGAVWIVNAKNKTITVFRSHSDVQVLSADENLQGATVVPGFTCPVGELFR